MEDIVKIVCKELGILYLRRNMQLCESISIILLLCD